MAHTNTTGSSCEGMPGEGALDSFCGSSGPFWDFELTWNTTDPDFTRCFERTALVWVPCGYIWLFAAIEIFYLKSSVDRLVPWTWLNISKIIGSSLLMVLLAVEFFFAVQKSTTDEPVDGVDYAAPAIIFCSVLLQLIFVVLEKKRGIQSSGFLFLFWLLLLLFGIPEYRTQFKTLNTDAYNEVNFVIYMIYYPMIVVLWVLNCFADACPQYVHFSRGEKPSPEQSASFFNRLLFVWIDPLVWTGYRRPVERKDLWNLSYENASEHVASVWDKNFQKTMRKAEKKASADTWASPPEGANHYEMSSGSKKAKKSRISILPTMVKTFGPSFFFGGVLKLAYDMLQFASPMILRYLISFSDQDEEGEPMWHGYFYAALMLIAAEAGSLILGQYFMKMFLIGLRIRTGVISAVYQKALKISSTARKESTVGEIVNLMSVDAQRFMDLTTYLNLLWSAPLQIVISLVLLWELLGVAVLAGVAVLIALIPVNGFIANKTKILQISQMKCKDKRVKLMNEILNGIKVLKLYAWEPSFEDQVMDVRNKEIKVLRKAAYLGAGTSFIWACTPFLVTLVMFMTYVLSDPQNILTSEKVFTSISLLNILRMPMTMLPFLIVATVQVSLASFATYVNLDAENILDAKKAFVAMSLFNLLRFPISMMPMLLTNMVQANVSLTRLNNFLNADELDPTCVSHDNTNSKAISVQNGTFAWGNDEEDSKPALQGINIDIDEGSLVAVVGTVGAGKSSLCSAILGEMEKNSGQINVKGSVSYVAQQAWIQNATLENNILFNKDRDDFAYDKCVKACALQADLDMLPGGDQTEIGEKGINLSGGQKQRVSLARAVYADTNIYLLDDPLSAVDSHVGKHIFEEVIGPQGVLKNKTRVLVTHGVTYLPQVDKIIVLKKGVVTEHGSYSELLHKKGEFQEFLLEYLSEAAEEGDENELEDLKSQLADNIGREVLQRQISKISEKSDTDHNIEDEKNAENFKRNVVRRRSTKMSETEKDPEKKPPPPKAGEKLIEAEKAETGKVSSSVYVYYIKAVGILCVTLTVIFGALAQAASVGSNVWLTAWTNENANLTEGQGQDPAVRDKYLGVYGAIGACQALFVMIQSFTLSYGALGSAQSLHKNLLVNIFHLPMSFFDTNPTGRMINRFSKDVDTMDNVLPMVFRSWLMCFFTVISTFVAIIIATKMFIVVVIPTMVIYYFVQILYVSTSRQLKRLESVSRSPIYSHFQETIQGASTVRAYGRQHQFIKMSDSKVDFNQVSYFPNVMANRWLAIRLETIGNILTFFAALFAVMSRGTISSGSVGFSVSYALSVTQILNWLVRMTADVETNIVAVERIKEYTETPQEAAWDIPSHKPSKDWPDKGVVVFNNYATRYREGLDLVVKDINCHVTACEKIGIVGRTGAGKSSLTLALFRIIEPANGTILMDGVDISKIGLHDLRKGLTIIPQDPVLFSGTLRMNLDPFNDFSDERVWSALEHSHLKEFVSGLGSGLQHEIAEGGDNLSVGQRQLVCLARALLRKSRILILDEATAAVDLETDALIQDTIRREFADSTVLTIAHRLNTIMDSTRVLVLDKGVIKEFDSPGALLKNTNSIFYGMAKDAGLV